MRIQSFLVAIGFLLVAAPAVARAQTLTDGHIAAIVVTANQVDIDAGKLAAERAASPDVRAFASVMVTDHSAVNEQAVELVTRLQVTPEESETSRALAEGGETHRANLRELDGPAFDRVYVDHEVAYHQQVIDALDATLIPGAWHPDLRALLVSVRPAFLAHLEHAKQLQIRLRADGR